MKTEREVLEELWKELFPRNVPLTTENILAIFTAGRAPLLKEIDQLNAAIDAKITICGDEKIQQLQAKVAMYAEKLNRIVTLNKLLREPNIHIESIREWQKELRSLEESATEQDVTRFTNSIRDDAYQLGGKHMIELLEEGYGFDFEPAGLNASIKHQLSLPYENKITIRQRRGEQV